MMSQEHVIAHFGHAAHLDETAAEAVLTAIASRLWARLLTASTKSFTETREWLLDFLKQLAAGDNPSIASISRELSFESQIGKKYVQLAAEAWLDQARLDEQRGLSPASSVFVEIEKFMPQAPGSMGGTHHSSEPSSEYSGDSGINPDLPREFERAARRMAPQSSPAPRPSPARHQVPKMGRGGVFRRMWNPFGKPSAPPPPPSAPGLSSSELRDRYFEARKEYLERTPQQQQADVPDEQANEYRVWFGTNRKCLDGHFTNGRGTQVSYGFCDVYVPKSHKIGSLGSSFLTRLVTMSDDRLKLRRVCRLADESMWQLIKAQLDSVDESERHAVVFIHGYNVSFAEAALRSAQIGFDLGVNGAMAFFSWPSKGTVQDYVADGASIEASEVAIADFLVAFAEKTNATAVHVIAHSMGNRGVLRAVTRIATNARERMAVPFANFILAAPDVDAETFRNLAGAYGQLSRRTTLYVSDKDKAVGLAAFIHDYPRVGFMPPVSVFAGIDTVSVSSIDLTMLGHGYVGEAREVLADMHSLIFQGLAPSERFSLSQASTAGGELYWTVRG